MAKTLADEFVADLEDDEDFMNAIKEEKEKETISSNIKKEKEEDEEDDDEEEDENGSAMDLETPTYSDIKQIAKIGQSEQLQDLLQVCNFTQAQFSSFFFFLFLFHYHAENRGTNEIRKERSVRQY